MNNSNNLIFIFNENNIFKSENKNGKINYYINDNIVNNNYYIKHKKIRNYIEYKYGNKRIYNSHNYNCNENNLKIKNEKFENFDIYRLNNDELNDFNSFISENSECIYNIFYNIDKFIIFKDIEFNDILNFFINKNIAYFKTRKINYFNIYSFSICYSNKNINQTKKYNTEFKNNINSNDITNEIRDDIISSAEKLNCYNCYFYENNNNNNNNANSRNNNIIFHFEYSFNYYSREKSNNMMKKILDGSEKFKEYMKENGLKNTNNQTKYIK